MTTSSGPDRAEARLLAGSFAKWKFDVIRVMLSDARLMASDFRVGVALLQHLGSDAWRIFPSQDLLAEETHMSRRNVIKCLDRLRLAGWLRWDRGHEQKSNEYEFDLDRLASAIAEMKRREASRKHQPRAVAKRRSDVNHSSHQKTPHMRTPVHIHMRTPVHTNNTIDKGLPSGPPRKKASK